MKRITIAVPLIMAVAIALTGCSAASGSSDLEPVDLYKTSNVEKMDCTTSTEVVKTISEAADARENSGQRKSLTEWGVKDVTDEKALADLIETLKEHKITACENEEPKADSKSKGQSSGTAKPDAGVSDAETSATLNSAIWGNLDAWDYPASFAKLVKDYGFETQKVSDQEFPKFTNCTSPYRVGRISTDAIIAPLAEKSANQVFAIILSCPAYGAHILSGLAQDETRIMGGKSLLEMNPFLKELKDPAVINDWAQEALEGTPKEQLVVAKKLALAAMLLMGLDTSPTIQQDTTSLNFHLVVEGDDGVLTVDPSNPFKVREFEINPVQYTGEFIVFEVSFKGQTGCWLRIGINTLDGRFVLLKCAAPPTLPPPPPSGGCIENCGLSICITDCLAGKDTSETFYYGAGEGKEKDAGLGDKIKVVDDGINLYEPEVKKTADPADPVLVNEGGDN